MNNALQTVATDFAGPDEPNSLVWAFCTWADTGTGRWRRRNAANSAWVDLGPLFAEPATPPDGALYASQVWVNKRLAEVGGKWATRGICEPVPVWDHIPGADIPPIDNPDFRYIKLTASDPYNAGVLTSESVSGSAPLVVATAVVSLAGSPLNGATVNLINTERRGLRGGESGTVESDQFQAYLFGDGSSPLSRLSGITYTSGGVATAHIGAPALVRMPDGANGVPRAGNETRMKNTGVTFYMRVL
ncbi:hypothetical protein ACXIUT_29825 [Achromobacter denitrificans]